MKHTLNTIFDATEKPDVVGTFALRVATLGSLRTEGRLAAADPLTCAQFIPFTLSIPAGSWRVDVLLAEKSRDVRVALARVVFRAGEPAHFELALTEGQDARSLKADERFGYGVDSGTGCFADPRVVIDGEALIAAMEKTYVNTWSSAITPGDACIAFSSGFGDGVYSSYFGLDANGDPICLVTDFGVLDIEVPQHETDGSFRRAEARRFCDALFDRLPWLGGDRHGDVWETAQELRALKEDAIEALPRLFAAIDDNDEEMARDVLTHVAGGLLGDTAALVMLAERMPTLSDEVLAALLRKRPPARNVAIARQLIDAIVSRWSNGSPSLRVQTLSLLGARVANSIDPSFGTLSEDALRWAVQNAADTEAVELASAAIEPYRIRAHLEDGSRGAAHRAPRAVVAILPEILASFDDSQLRRIALDTMVVQSETEPLGALLADAGSPTRGAIALALSREEAWRDRAIAVLRAIAADPARSHDERFDAVSHFNDPREQCGGYLALGLSGWEAAPIQLGYLARQARGEVLAALERLVKEAPTQELRNRAKKTLARLQAASP